MGKKLSKFRIFRVLHFSNVFCLQHILGTFFELLYLYINEFGISIRFFLDTPYLVCIFGHIKTFVQTLELKAYMVKNRTLSNT
jgi:hypothetical protein